MTDSQHGRLIVLCGPAGVGKGTVLGACASSTRKSGCRYPQPHDSLVQVKWMA